MVRAPADGREQQRLVTRPGHEPARGWLVAAVATGGAFGGLLRWSLGEALPVGDGFPWVTWWVNVTGSFALALLPLVLFAREPLHLAPAWRHVVAALAGPGLLGGFTTLSAYSLETRDMLAGDRPLLGLAYAVSTLLAAVAAVALARRLEREQEPS